MPQSRQLAAKYLSVMIDLIRYFFSSSIPFFISSRPLDSIPYHPCIPLLSLIIFVVNAHLADCDKTFLLHTEVFFADTCNYQNQQQVFSSRDKCQTMDYSLLSLIIPSNPDHWILRRDFLSPHLYLLVWHKTGACYMSRLPI